jgi:hypothetical protein
MSDDKPRGPPTRRLHELLRLWMSLPDEHGEEAFLAVLKAYVEADKNDRSRMMRTCPDRARCDEQATPRGLGRAIRGQAGHLHQARLRSDRVAATDRRHPEGRAAFDLSCCWLGISAASLRKGTWVTTSPSPNHRPTIKHPLDLLHTNDLLARSLTRVETPTHPPSRDG